MRERIEDLVCILGAYSVFILLISALVFVLMLLALKLNAMCLGDEGGGERRVCESRSRVGRRVRESLGKMVNMGYAPVAAYIYCQCPSKPKSFPLAMVDLVMAV